MLGWAKSGKIIGVTSEIVLDEARIHAKRIRLSSGSLEKKVFDHLKVCRAPKSVDKKYSKLVTDIGDIHLFTSSEKLKADYLVSLDKKHVLSLNKKIRKFKIVSPGDLITQLMGKV